MRHGDNSAVAGGRVAVWREVGADLETPVSAYLKIRQSPYGFLFESVEGGERIGRYSFLGAGPSAVLIGRGQSLEEHRAGRMTVTKGNPLEILRRRFKFGPVAARGLPRFDGGLVGYVGYDAVRYVERLPHAPKDDLGVPEIFLMEADSVLVFDHVRHTITILAHSPVTGGRSRATALAAGEVDRIAVRLAAPLVPPAPVMPAAAIPRFETNLTRGKFLAGVVAAKRHIRCGDIIQVVLSQRFSVPFKGDAFGIYRAMRILNPSPYMFFLECGGTSLAGSSPEMLVRLEGDEVETRPIAGTRPRGRTAEEDLKLEKELRADPKERAEHVMLVDLGRNDLGRVCRYGTVRVEDNMVVERYSHVMHLVSGVKGRLVPGKNAFDVLAAVFPAGTVSGAPKVRAMEIIDELEPTRRGVYAGIAGYIAHSGNMDTAIAIRTVMVRDGVARMQAGMGIVADSVPELEFEESFNKARHGLLAIASAGGKP